MSKMYNVQNLQCSNCTMSLMYKLSQKYNLSQTYIGPNVNCPKCTMSQMYDVQNIQYIRYTMNQIHKIFNVQFVSIIQILKCSTLGFQAGCSAPIFYLSILLFLGTLTGTLRIGKKIKRNLENKKLKNKFSGKPN